MPFRVFISLSLGKAEEAGRSLKAALEACGVSTFLYDDIASVDGDAAQQRAAVTVSSALAECDLAVVLGTTLYGWETASKTVCTAKQMEYIINEQKKPFFLVKMCERFRFRGPRENFRGTIRATTRGKGKGKFPTSSSRGSCRS